MLRFFFFYIYYGPSPLFLDRVNSATSKIDSASRRMGKKGGQVYGTASSDDVSLVVYGMEVPHSFSAKMLRRTLNLSLLLSEWHSLGGVQSCV